MAREGLGLRLQMIRMLANERINLLKQLAENPTTPTKGAEIIQFMKQALRIVAPKLADPEPTPVVLTEEQIQLGLMKTVSVSAKATHTIGIVERIDQAALTDESGQPITNWTPEQVAAADAHLMAALTALSEAIEAL